MSCVNVFLCSSLTQQKKGDSNSNTTSRYNRESMAKIVFVYIQSITKIFEKKSAIYQWLATVHQQRANRLFVSRRRYSYFFSGVCRNCLLSCFLLCRRMPHKAQLWEWITKGNTRIKCAQMRANACASTRFLTCVWAKVVRVRWPLISDLYCISDLFFQNQYFIAGKITGIYSPLIALAALALLTWRLKQSYGVIINSIM